MRDIGEAKHSATVAAHIEPGCVGEGKPFSFRVLGQGASPGTTAAGKRRGAEGGKKG